MEGTYQSTVRFSVVVKMLRLYYSIIEADLCEAVALCRLISILSDVAIAMPTDLFLCLASSCVSLAPT